MYVATYMFCVFVAHIRVETVMRERGVFLRKQVKQEVVSEKNMTVMTLAKRIKYANSKVRINEERRTKIRI